MDQTVLPFEPGALPYTYWAVDAGKVRPVAGGLIEEAWIGLYVNGQELATLMCSPTDEEALALGFLYNEGVIRSLDDVRLVQASMTRTTVDVFLTRPDFDPPRRMVLTSGCSGGISFRNLAEIYPPLVTDFTTTPDVILARLRDLQKAGSLYRRVGSVHTSVLGNEQDVLISAQDVGRHNTIDKIAGKALQTRIEMRDRVLLTSGRISSEMMSKARQMGVPVVASRTGPTSLAVQLARAWHICVVGYIHLGKMQVYTHPYRLGLPVVESQTARS
jgi:FdhD protein